MTTIRRESLQQARLLHQDSLVLDTHCDTTQRLADPDWDLSQRHHDGHVDIPRLHEAGVDAMFFAVWTPELVDPGASVAAAWKQIRRVHETIDRHDRHLALARNSAEVRQARAQGRIAILIAIDGAA